MSTNQLYIIESDLIVCYSDVIQSGSLKSIKDKELFKVCLGDVVDRFRWLIMLMLILLHKFSNESSYRAKPIVGGAPVNHMDWLYNVCCHCHLVYSLMSFVDLREKQISLECLSC